MPINTPQEQNKLRNSFNHGSWESCCIHPKDSTIFPAARQPDNERKDDKKQASSSQIWKSARVTKLREAALELNEFKVGEQEQDIFELTTAVQEMGPWSDVQENGFVAFLRERDLQVRELNIATLEEKAKVKAAELEERFVAAKELEKSLANRQIALDKHHKKLLSEGALDLMRNFHLQQRTSTITSREIDIQMREDALDSIGITLKAREAAVKLDQDSMIAQKANIQCAKDNLQKLQKKIDFEMTNRELAVLDRERKVAALENSLML